MFGSNKKAKGVQNGGHILMVPTDTILPNPNQPRKTFDETALRSLAQSIAENGILQPLSVQFSDGHAILVAGERRWRAARMAGLTHVPCVEVSADNDAHRAILALIENIQRVDMNCFEEAEGIGRLIAEFGLTQQEAATRLGYAQPTVANKLRLLQLSPSIRRRMAGADLTERHARALLRLEGTSAREWVLDKVLSERLNVTQTERLVEDVLRGTPPRKAPTLVVRDVRLFVNTVKHAVDTMRKAGIGASWERRDTETDVEYVIHVPAECCGRDTHCAG